MTLNGGNRYGFGFDQPQAAKKMDNKLHGMAITPVHLPPSSILGGAMEFLLRRTDYSLRRKKVSLCPFANLCTVSNKIWITINKSCSYWWYPYSCFMGFGCLPFRVISLNGKYEIN
jgi:hypothetical protein